jgi:hypothetical protein
MVSVVNGPEALKLEALKLEALKNESPGLFRSLRRSTS